MHPIESRTLDSLDFETAAGEEGSTWRNLLPPEPWLSIVSSDPGRFATYARFRLEAGITSAPSAVIRARKPHQQTRPVPVVGVPERIAYRAFCNAVLATQEAADRSADSYREFIAGPIKLAFEGQGGRMHPGRANFHYLVESDIAAFYEYVNHPRLLHELQLRTQSVEMPRHLIELLGEIQGRPVGLPQLLDPSDELSEVYARIIERELRRKGIPVWRYNDDFKLAAHTYEEAQSHLETLAQEASAIGLILNEKKTRILKFSTYFWSNWFEFEKEGDVEFKPELIKVSSEYGELDVDEALMLAQVSVSRLATSDEDGKWDVRNLRPEQARTIGQAFGLLSKLYDPAGLAYVPMLFEYVPHLTARLGRYLAELGRNGIQIEGTWDAIIVKSGVYNAWQRVWLVYVARDAGLLDDAARQGWVRAQRDDPDPLLRAEAALALAPHGVITFDEIDLAVRVEPEALIPWYALAAKSIPNVNQNRLLSLKQGHGLIEVLLSKAPRKAS